MGVIEEDLLTATALIEQAQSILTNLAGRCLARDALAADARSQFRVYDCNRKEFVGGDAQNIEVVKTVSSASKPGGEDMHKWISKRSDGRYIGRRMIKKTQVCVYARTEKECIRKLNAAVKAVMTASDKKKALMPSVHDYILTWLELFKRSSLTDSVYQSYVNCVNKHLKLNVPMNAVDVESMQAFINSLPATDLREKIYRLLKPAFKKAVGTGLIPFSPMEYVELGKIQHGKRTAIPLDKQAELIRALEHYKYDNRVFVLRVMVMLCTGVRPAEFAKIKLADKGYILVEGTKTRNATRWIKVSDKVADIVKNAPPDFFKFDGKRFTDRLTSFCQSKINLYVSPYTLRHTFSNNLYVLRVPEIDRMQYMGHTTTRTTNDYYTEFSPGTTPQDIYDIYGDWYPNF